MPRYTFQDITTQEVSEIEMKISELDSFKQKNQNLKQLIVGMPAIGDSVRLGLKKPDSEFRDILKNVKSIHKKNNINDF